MWFGKWHEAFVEVRHCRPSHCCCTEVVAQKSIVVFTFQEIYCWLGHLHCWIGGTSGPTREYKVRVQIGLSIDFLNIKKYSGVFLDFVRCCWENRSAKLTKWQTGECLVISSSSNAFPIFSLRNSWLKIPPVIPVHLKFLSGSACLFACRKYYWSFPREIKQQKRFQHSNISFPGGGDLSVCRKCTTLLSTPSPGLRCCRGCATWLRRRGSLLRGGMLTLSCSLRSEHNEL